MKTAKSFYRFLPFLGLSAGLVTLGTVSFSQDYPKSDEEAVLGCINSAPEESLESWGVSDSDWESACQEWADPDKALEALRKIQIEKLTGQAAKFLEAGAGDRKSINNAKKSIAKLSRVDWDSESQLSKYFDGAGEIAQENFTIALSPQGPAAGNSIPLYCALQLTGNEPYKAIGRDVPFPGAKTAKSTTEEKLKKVGAIFTTAMNSQLKKYPAGRALLEKLKSQPSVGIRKQSPEDWAEYLEAFNGVVFNTINLIPLIEYAAPSARKVDLEDPDEFADYVLSHPGAVEEIVDKIDVTYYHELIHALQEQNRPRAKVKLTGEKIISGGIYPYAIEREWEAFISQHKYLMEKLRSDPNYFKANDEWSVCDVETCDEYMASAKDYKEERMLTYTWECDTLDTLIDRENSAIDEIMMEAVAGNIPEWEMDARIKKRQEALNYLEKTKTYYYEVWETQEKKEWPKESYEFFVLKAKAFSEEDPGTALSCLTDAQERASQNGFLNEVHSAGIASLAKTALSNGMERLQEDSKGGIFVYSPSTILESLAEYKESSEQIGLPWTAKYGKFMDKVTKDLVIENLKVARGNGAIIDEFYIPWKEPDAESRKAAYDLAVEVATESGLSETDPEIAKAIEELAPEFKEAEEASDPPQVSKLVEPHNFSNLYILLSEKFLHLKP